MYRWLEELDDDEILREVDSHICPCPTNRETLLYERSANAKLNGTIAVSVSLPPTPIYSALCSSFARTSEWPLRYSFNASALLF
jgi:hypothetical protein